MLRTLAPFPDFPYLRKKHKNMIPFILRQWQESDVPALAKFLNNKKIWDNCRDSLPYPYTSQDAAAFMRYIKVQEVQNNYCIEINAEAAGNIRTTLIVGMAIMETMGVLSFVIAILMALKL